MSPARARWIVAAVLAAIALAHAAGLAWTSDAAFIPFRYARNWVEHGVPSFNAGERVEGFTNPLWVAVAAAAIALGIPPEKACGALGIVAFVGAAVLVGRRPWWRDDGASSGPWAPPIAGLALATHRDWAAFASSGLETSLLALEVVALLALLAPRAIDARRGGAAGLVAACAALTRHDALLFVAVGAASLVAPRRFRTLAAYLAGFAAVWGPATWLRFRAFGDLVPTTFHARSVADAYWTQGLTYLGLTFEYRWLDALVAWIGLAATIAWAVARRRQRPSTVLPETPALRLVALATSFVVVHIVYVVRVGGDPMFGRFLVPVAGPLAVLLEGLARWLAHRSAPRAALVVGALACAQAVTPSPVGASPRRDGIVDARANALARSSDAERAQDVRRVAAAIRGVPLRTAIWAAEARFAYDLRLDPVIEAGSGTADRSLARRPLQKRGLLGTEKHAPLPFLVHEVKVDLVFHRSAEAYKLDGYLPKVLVEMGGFQARLIHWDERVVAALRANGADVPDFPARLDALIAKLDGLKRTDVRFEYARAWNFYFAHNADPRREAPFIARLGERDAARAREAEWPF